MELDRAGEPRFTQEEMSEIIDAAARLDGLSGDPADLTLQDVTQIGAELGISPDAVREVVARRERERAAEAAARAKQAAAEARREQERAQQWRRWRNSLARLIPMAAFFLILDLVTGGSLDWWYWPVLGVGIAFIGQTTRLLLRADHDEDEGHHSRRRGHHGP